MIYRLLIIIATLIWGSSFVIVKDLTDTISPTWLVAARFLVAALVLAILFAKRCRRFFNRTYIGLGCLFGVVIFAAYWLQTIGIVYTTPGKNAFLTATYCVMVPFVAWALIGRRPTRFSLLAACLGITGIGFVSLESGFSVNVGDALTLACAIFYAIHIVIVAKFSISRDIFVLTTWQFAMMGVLGVVCGIIFEWPMPDWSALDAATWGAFWYLSIACSAIALLFQNIAQKNLAPSSAALLLSLEAPFGVLFSVLLGAEVLSVRLVVGFILIFAAIVVSELFGLKASKQNNKDERRGTNERQDTKGKSST